jgi:hypothetical protein
MQATVCGGDYAATKLAYGTFGRSQGELRYCGHKQFDELSRDKASEITDTLKPVTLLLKLCEDRKRQSAMQFDARVNQFVNQFLDMPPLTRWFLYKCCA